ncbi:hypothetical protein GLOIN_2v1488958 [Rhizophagus irregularis DAOM 181602=DAOM 197198]|uniref:C2H2-type domain-containing protein n=1 Tax=Rhizophagus irregularis (strain DAOM 181602 / DAOM 197198 / MUCL 43194) TaxID=747089 RepID=A0A2P4NXW2_RHIID|nr:hypothetical protein GLOIN_2v1488958 [Rhizophagus irregularis DAOM 181602=DAOM 197198]POG57974.1 hypothetical protein GLOIN_2v1488958 [Rhizophagus irregularis DAOM 181602=DAOM 197198]|eukprot:XP_025164840.1 hypothetical protein GLOIN_2v1488958 [Rhizophagus irregularis DAOM 181602=DAOM 197198]
MCRRAQHLNEINRNQRYGTMVNFTGINAPASLRDIDRFEENNPTFAVNDFKPVLSEKGEELKTHKLDPLRISEYNYRREHLVDLILFTQGEEGLTDRRNINDVPEGLNTHYCLINGEAGWHRIMRNWNKHHDHKYFCRHCLRAPFSRLDLLEDHIAFNCHGRNNPYAGQREIFPKKGKHISKFTNIKALLKAPFVIYPDNECDSNKLDEKEEDKNKNTVKTQKQVNNSFGYVMIQNDSDIISNVFRRTANSVEEKWKNMQEDLQMVKEILQNPVELKMTTSDWEKHNSARKCYLCDGLLQEVSPSVHAYVMDHIFVPTRVCDKKCPKRSPFHSRLSGKSPWLGETKPTIIPFCNFRDGLSQKSRNFERLQKNNVSDCGRRT